ncbi:hypothetical protein PUNSTDRAFT_139332 [Punctularia strigosozonata HHB-11173 SS5]|uniref:F-box domain-containing protein n=1 Tax=Punctularia strigosozonata (strain HHB-11173) TaxID=741275 RepID=R7S2X6_PUNST|nr:uncharacterized protein PUNSTDRAFT_139332 [Punctularia strigosozonata HHB-11173 SS5]EIN03606.1 hypothetical protein PUNSTDRAFT_139332 [Punctularia strigosozonata HHB-11173 SS5]
MLRRPGNLGESEHRHRGALSDPPAVTSSYLEVRDEGPYASGSMPLQGGNGSYTLMAGETFRSLSGGYGGSSTYGSSDHYGYEGVAGGSQRSSSSRDTHSFSYTGFQMPSPADESRYRIDSQIGHWLEQIRGLCESRNRLSPIYKLPNEILSYIFCYCMPSSKDNAHAPSSYMFLENASELWLRSNGATKTVLPLLVESSPKRNPLSVKPILLPAVRRIRFNFEQRRPSQDLLSRMRNLLTRRHKLTNGTLAYTLFNGSLRYPELEKLRQVAGGVELVEELYGAGAPSDGELDLGHEQESDDE